MTTITPAPEKTQLDRRSFLVKTVGGLSLGFFLPAISKVAELQASTAVPGQVNAWLKIGTNEIVTLTIGSSEMGQGSFSGLAQILAEELMVSYRKVVTVQGAPSLDAN